MIYAVMAVIVGLGLLVWSADRFIEGAASVARHLGMPPLLIGMVIVGFGTSAPEMVVSAISASQGNPGIALGNAFGSNITNIALILGLTSIISPIAVHSKVLRKELPILSAVTILVATLIWDGNVSRMDAFILLFVFCGLMGWSVWQGLQRNVDSLAEEVEEQLAAEPLTLPQAGWKLVLGLLLLVGSSRVLVWGAVAIAEGFGVSNLIIGLTIVAIGTSLPELASSLIATRRKEHDIALGNVIGSNLFNTLAVIGIAGAIHPMAVEPEVFSRDMTVMVCLTLSLFVFGYGFRNPQKGRINRVEGAVLLCSYIAYTFYLIYSVFG